MRSTRSIELPHYLIQPLALPQSKAVVVAAPLIYATARLAQSVERKALNLVVVGSSPTVGALYVFILARCVVLTKPFSNTMACRWKDERTMDQRALSKQRLRMQSFIDVRATPTDSITAFTS